MPIIKPLSAVLLVALIVSGPGWSSNGAVAVASEALEEPNDGQGPADSDPTQRPRCPL